MSPLQLRNEAAPNTFIKTLDSRLKMSGMTEGRKQIPSFDRPFAKLRAYSGQALRSE